MKDIWDYYVTGHSGTIAMAGACRQAASCWFANNTNNEDLEIANCEFRNSHDGIQL